jgi:hypothetical protein
MFARKATFGAIDRVHSIARAEPVHSNDNDAHRMAGVPHAPVLMCQWHIAPVTGKPECHWRIERISPTRFGGERKPQHPRPDPAR